MPRNITVTDIILADQFTSNSAQILRVDAQCTVVTTALKSYMKWLASQRGKGKHPVSIPRGFPEHGLTRNLQDEESNNLDRNLEEWCRRLMNANFEVWSNIVSHIAKVLLTCD